MFHKRKPHIFGNFLGKERIRINEVSLYTKTPSAATIITTETLTNWAILGCAMHCRQALCKHKA